MPHSVNSSKKIDTGLQADPAHMKREFDSSDSMLGTLEISHAEKSIDLKARVAKSSLSCLNKVQLSVIAKHSDGRYFIIAKN